MLAQKYNKLNKHSILRQRKVNSCQSVSAVYHTTSVIIRMNTEFIRPTELLSYNVYE